jgi:catechol 2,3-dioxygenase-like lactoylglutathione lyase family enzyme
MPKRFWLNQINTTDLDRLAGFYKDVLGFVEDDGLDAKPGLPPPPTTVMDALGLEFPERMLMLRLPGDVFRLEMLQWPRERFVERPRDMNAGGSVRVGLMSEDIDADIARVRASGVAMIFDGEMNNLNWGSVRYCFFRDPDDNLVEFFQGDVENR